MHLDDLDTPALWADLDVVERNLARMSSYCREHGLALRPHIKTHKVPQLAWRQIEYGAVGITSAKVTEAQVMAAAGLEDILLAYPLWGETKWKNLAALAERAAVTVATDSAEHAAALADGLGAVRGKISLLVEVDVGSGRTGLAIDDRLSASVARIAGTGIEVAGIMFYPGHLKEPDDASLAELSGRIARAREAFERAGVTVRVVSGGSTPTAYHSHRIEGLTEIRPGTYIYNDCNYVRLGAARWEDCALKVRCRVVSTSVAGRAILDGGSKSFSDAASVTGSGFGRLVQCTEVLCEKMNEEHGYLALGNSGWRPRPGDLADVIPNHACTTVNMHRVINLVRGDEVVEVLPIAAQGKIH
ncbi:MAG TPA: alanine racemase [Candidatus Glassbacteria bacterium]|nr:alanine racemase [Candidatus Glassbacteria bacterium]